MEEITAELLEAFAMGNGLRIMSHRDPIAWAKKINANGGLCPCGKECPCDDCTCKFYEKGEMMEETDTEEPMVEEEAPLIIKTEEFAKAIDALEDAKELLQSIGEDNEHNEKAAMDAAKLVEEDAGKHTCGKCATYMEGLGRKLTWLSAECAKDPVSCAIERDATIKRVEDMQSVFVEADKEMDDKPETNNESQETTEILDSPLTYGSEEGFSNYHTCVGKTFNEDLDGVPMGDKMCVSSKMCSKAGMSKEDAIKACAEANKK